VSAFSIEDFPTFERPTNASSAVAPRSLLVARRGLHELDETTWTGTSAPLPLVDPVLDELQLPLGVEALEAGVDSV
jgi:hypothetical protein